MGNERKAAGAPAVRDGSGQRVKLVRVTTVPVSLRVLLRGQPAFMRSNGFEVILVSSPGEDWDAIPDLNEYQVFRIRMARNIALPGDLVSLWRVYRLLRRLRPEIVHSHTPKAGLLAMGAAWLAGIPVRMHTVAGLPLMESKGLRRRVLEWAERWTYRCATRVYPNSFRLKDYIESAGFAPPSKLKVLAAGSSNGIDADYFRITPALADERVRWRSQHGIAEEDVVFVFVGRLVRDKGIHELAEAFERLSMTSDSVWLLLVGAFEDGDPVGAEVRRALEGNPRVISTGYQQDVRPYLACSDVLAFPSYREGFPNVPLQAGCFDLPCIVTDINGCNEIVEEGVNGLIIPPKDTGSLFGAMARMAADSGLRERCGSSARARILTKFSQSVVWKALLDEYLSLIDPLQQRLHT